MCGLVAVMCKWSNGFTSNQLDIMDQLLTVDTLRGEDSTGAFLVNNEGNVGIVKDAVTGGALVATDEYQVLRKRAFSDGTFFVGHNRKATSGTISDKNAHPFWVEEKLVLVHNGSYFGSHKELADVEVDSEAIAIHLSKAEDVEKALQKVNAAYALIWYDIEKKELRIVSNGQRPLHWAEDHGAYYVASEADMLEYILKRNGIKNPKVSSFTLDGMHVFRLEDKRIKSDFKKMDVKYKGGTFRQQVSSYKSRGADYRQWWQGRHHYQACGYEQGLYIEEGADTTPIPRATPTVQELNKELEKVDKDIVEANKKIDEAVDRIKADKNKNESSALPIYPHYPEVTYDRWTKLKENTYLTGNKVSVVVEDFIQSDNNVKEVIVTGKVLDNNGLTAWFKLDFNSLESITEDTIMDTVFEITVDGVSWRRNANRVVEGKNGIINLDEQFGWAFVKGVNPKIRFTGDGVGHA